MAFRERLGLPDSLDLLGSLDQTDLRAQLVQLGLLVLRVIEGTLDLWDQMANQVHLDPQDQMDQEVSLDPLGTLETQDLRVNPVSQVLPDLRVSQALLVSLATLVGQA